jgi:hypothetical protein
LGGPSGDNDGDKSLDAGYDTKIARHVPEFKKRASSFGSHQSTRRDGTGMLQPPLVEPPPPASAKSAGVKERRELGAEQTHGKLGEVSRVASSASITGQTWTEGSTGVHAPPLKPQPRPSLRRQGSSSPAALKAPADEEMTYEYNSADGRYGSEQRAPSVSCGAQATSTRTLAEAELERRDAPLPAGRALRRAVTANLPLGAPSLTGVSTYTFELTPQLGATSGWSRPTNWCPAQRYWSKPASAIPPPLTVGTPVSASRAHTPNIIDLGTHLGPDPTVCTGSGDGLVAQLVREAAAGKRATLHTGLSNSASMPALRSTRVSCTPGCVADTLQQLAASAGTFKAAYRRTTAPRWALVDPFAPTLTGGRGTATMRREVLPEEGAERRAQQQWQLQQSLAPAPPGRALARGLTVQLSHHAGLQVAACSPNARPGTTPTNSTYRCSEQMGNTRTLPEVCSTRGAESSMNGLATGVATGLSVARIGNVRGAPLALSMLRKAKSNPQLTTDLKGAPLVNHLHDCALSRSPTGAAVPMPPYNVAARGRDRRDCSAPNIARLRAYPPAAAAGVLAADTRASR